jgi:hypothetical protein
MLFAKMQFFLSHNRRSSFAGLEVLEYLDTDDMLISVPSLHDATLLGFHQEDRKNLTLTFREPHTDNLLRFVVSSPGTVRLWCSGVITEAIVSEVWISQVKPTFEWINERIATSTAERLDAARRVQGLDAWLAIFEVHYGDTFAIFGARALGPGQALLVKE